MNILIVEDDRTTADNLRFALASSGYAIRVACDGIEGLAEIVRWSPDLILTDISSPGMTDLAFCKHVRERSQVPIIVISAQAAPRTIAAALDAGADDYVSKPFSIPVLQARIRGFSRRSLKR